MKQNEKHFQHYAGLNGIGQFQYYFTNKHGYYLVFERTPPIHQEDISLFQKKMIEANNIPRLLKLEIREVDEEIKIYFQLDRKKKLSHLLKINGLTELALCEIFLQLVLALQQTNNFMLDEQNFVLDIDFVFVGEDVNDIFLTYVPIKHHKIENTTHAQLQSVLNQMRIYLNDTNCNVYNDIFEACKDSGSFEKLQFMLVDHISYLNKSSLDVKDQKVKLEVNESIFYSDDTYTKKKYEDIFIGSDETIFNSSANEDYQFQKSDENVFSQKQFEYLSQQNLTNEPEQIRQDNRIYFYSLTLRLRILASICICLTLYIIWNLVLTNGTEPYTYTGAGASFCLLAFWTLICFYGFPRMRSWRLFFTIFHIHFKEKKINKINPSTKNIGSSLNPSLQDYSGSEQYYNDLPLRTTLMGKDLERTTILNLSEQETVFLASQKITMPKAYLIDKHHDDIKKIIIEKEVFRIGRIQDGVEMMINETGVSRLHAEILKTSDGYVIKDLQSKNGVMLNNNLIAPYQTYPLLDGDVIQIIRKEFIFRIDSLKIE